mgnify:CR=1 FL=1
MNKETHRVDKLFIERDFAADSFSFSANLKGKRIIMYGAGESSHWFSEIVMKIHGYQPSLVLDLKFKEGDEYEGIPACSPLDYIPEEGEKKNAIVVISSGKQEYHTEIVNCVKDLGFLNIIFLQDIYEIHNPFSQPDELQQQGFSFYLKQKKQIISAFELFEDEMSIEVYRCFLQTHMQRKPVAIPVRPRNEQYFPKDIKLNKGYSHFVSCGAYDGDSIRLLNEMHGKVEEIICFEAEPAIFSRLSSYLSEHGRSLANNITAFPCAVYSDESIMNFTSATGLGSRLSEQGSAQVQTAALDHVLPNFSPSFISMDIEGAEPEALKGAENMIREHRPDLAICVYHSPNHLWDIPLYINSLGLGYKFYLRNYTSFTIETVLYATV